MCDVRQSLIRDMMLCMQALSNAFSIKQSENRQNFERTLRNELFDVKIKD